MSGGLRAAVITASREMGRTGLTPGTSGNISVRTKGGMLITPSGVPYESLKPKSIVKVAHDGTATGRFKPSSEWRFHLAIYAGRSEANAIVHTHSDYATALSCARRAVPAFHYMVAVAGGKDIPCAPYATFGTKALAANVAETLAGRRACLLANHGQVAIGATLDEAFRLAQEVETLARHYVLTLSAGDVTLLDDAEMARIIERFKDYGRSEP